MSWQFGDFECGLRQEMEGDVSDLLQKEQIIGYA